MGRASLPPRNFRIVTLCGSLGALSAYIQILKVTPHDSGMAFVVLIHRRTGTARALVDVLSSATEMPVKQIRNGDVLLPNHVYVMPPGLDLSTNGIVFKLVPISKAEGWPNCFDVFLRSMAKNTKNRAVTVILSGLGADGSAALRDLRLSGGVTFAQSDAESTNMPNSAVATGNVDYFCSAVTIGDLIMALPPAQPSRLEFGLL